MRLRNDRERYGLVAMALHWLIALAVLGLLGLGFVMVRLAEDPALQFRLYQLHKSLGITVLGLSLVRLGWRLAHPAPPLPETLKPWERQAARATHVLFYALIIGLPLSGWALVSASPWNIPTVLYGIVTLPHWPVLETLSDKPAAEAALKQVHAAGAWMMIGLLALHVGAALRHHFLLRDGVLLRMLPVRPRQRPAPVADPERIAR